MDYKQELEELDQRRAELEVLIEAESMPPLFVVANSGRQMDVAAEEWFQRSCGTVATIGQLPMLRGCQFGEVRLMEISVDTLTVENLNELKFLSMKKENNNG